MKRKAILIGNSNGLQGVPIDLKNYRSFLKSERGGAWLDSEILTIENPSLTFLNAHILNVKLNDRPDFVFLVFSGHGEYRKSGTVFGINRTETIEENKLWSIAKRQITIADCCRGVETEELRKSLEMFADGGKIGSALIRKFYDDRIMKSDEQQARFYSCSVGETSIDTGRSGGGLYTKNLFKSIQEAHYIDYLTINDAHDIASKSTAKEAMESEQHSQNPDSRVIRCLSAKQLIIAVNPRISRIFG